ncbi:MAG: hypothetical protein KatS3mg104_0188 [Phycisphaerae bacterium]|jgi:rod shape-determining protein MreD|nr:MAG: hypothetical protein KatS3mg104_0188 [Phycisphaerae bacterium]
MRWISFTLMAYVMLGLQIGLYPFVPVNFVLIATVFVSLNAPRQVAVPACFILGLLHDLIGIGPIGMYAAAYAGVALLTASDQHAMASDHPISHFLVTLFSGFVVGLIVKLIDAWRDIGTSLLNDLLTGFYTALASVVVLHLLTKLRRKFRFRSFNTY